MKSRRILVVWTGPETGTCAVLFKALRDVLARHHQVLSGPTGVVQGTKMRKRANLLACEVRRWPQIIKSEAIILHSYVALSLPTVLLAWVLRKRIIMVMWDTYPITVNGQRLGGRFRRLFDSIEQFAVKLATRVVIPTEDFAGFITHPDVRVMPLWPSLPLGQTVPRRQRSADQPVRLAFVGQAGLTRGLPEAILRLAKQAPTRFELHIFSPHPPEPEWSSLAPNVTVFGRGYLTRDVLLAALDDMDFGLISLHPGMGQPGFPSKTFDYLASGLPVIYTGRPLPAFEALIERTGVGIPLRDAEIQWDKVLQQMAVSMPEAVRAFAEETELTIEKLEQALF